MRVSKKKLKIVCLIVAAILLTEGLTNILLDSKREVLAADVKEAVQVDVYHFDSGKKTFACSIEQSNGLGFSFGEKEATVFGEEVAHHLHLMPGVTGRARTKVLSKMT